MLAAASIKVRDALFGFLARNDAECCKRELLGRSWRRDRGAPKSWVVKRPWLNRTLVSHDGLPRLRKSQTVVGPNQGLVRPVSPTRISPTRDVGAIFQKGAQILPSNIRNNKKDAVGAIPGSRFLKKCIFHDRSRITFLFEVRSALGQKQAHKSSYDENVENIQPSFYGPRFGKFQT